MANFVTNRISHTDDWRHPIWTLRIAPLISVISLILALTVWTSGRIHEFCIGMAVGQLTVLCITVFFQLDDITLRNDPDASTVQQLGLNH
jgi:hypothetical protein